MRTERDVRTTATIGAVALALIVLTWITAPHAVSTAAFADRGQLFFPTFTDPNAAASLEVTRFDVRTATVQPFKVQNRNGRWTIPSQHDYPADATDRLSRVAAAIIALKRDDVASDNAVDYDRFGVLDPLDTTLPNVSGRGTRLLVRGAHDQTLADVIIGRPVDAHPELRYIRLPNQKRVYVSRTGDLRISTAFGDWIERDLLQLDPDEIDAVNLRNYALDRSTGKVNPGETLLLQRAKDGAWSMNGLQPNEQLDLNALGRLLQNLATLRIAGVLTKPAGITATLRQEVSRTTITPEDRADLARKGFYLTGDGQLVANRGEVVVRTVRGVYYTLRFGDVAPAGDAETLDDEPPADADVSNPPGDDDAVRKPVPRENRYLFIMAEHDPAVAESPGRAAEGAQKVQELRARFAPWYYLISADHASTLQLRRSSLVKHKG
jgi:hypothetical protein